MKLELQLGCFGYFGFGSGYALAKFGRANDSGELYCGRCELRSACWQAHRSRVRGIFPDATALADEIAVTHHGPAYIEEWRRRTEQVSKNFVEPYLGVMSGNLQDGGQVALTGRPNDRGGSTLTWPLTPIPRGAS